LLFNAKLAVFLLYHGEKKIHFNKMMMISAYSNWIVVVLAHWNNSCSTKI